MTAKNSKGASRKFTLRVGQSMRMRLSIRSLLLVSAVAPFLSAPVMAQNTEALPVSREEPADPGDGEIVVTAQKRVERLQDVPIAVNAVGAEQLDNSGINDLQALNTLVPGYNSVNSVGSFRPSIRGIATGSDTVENAVAIYIDGVYLPNQREGLRELADIEQITVLKGPQGTLFGRNATAGVLQITTRRPSFDHEGEINIGYDNYGTFRGSAYFSGAVTDTIAASVSTSYVSQGEGYGRSLTANLDTYKLRDDLALRGKLLIVPSDRTELTLIGDYQYREDSGTHYAPFPGTQFSFDGFGPTTSRYDTYSSIPEYNRFDGGGVSLQLNHEFNFAELVSITAYRRGISKFRFNLTNTADAPIISTSRIESENYSQELQLISPDEGPFRWVVGAFYFHNELGYDPQFNDFTGVFEAFPDQTIVAFEEAESFAPFAQADYELTPATTLTLGARWTYEKRTIRGTDTNVASDGSVTVRTPIPDSSLTVKEPTWRIAINHKFTDDIMAYASYSRGFKSGGYNIVKIADPAYLPEKLDDWEIGLKTELFDRRLTLNIGAFYYDYKNLQVIAFVPSPGGSGLTPQTTNGAKSKLYGVDVDLAADLGGGLSVSGGFEILHAEFTDYQNASISMPRPGGGATITPGDATGNRLPLAQEFVGTMSVNYEMPIVDDWMANFNVTGTYNGDYYFEADNFLRQPSYVMLNASVRIADPSDTMSIRFAVNNILDEAVVTRVATNSLGYRANWGTPPRIYSVTAGMRF